jgi:solute carrier family 39 (zinc transporter), member 9
MLIVEQLNSSHVNHHHRLHTSDHNAGASSPDSVFDVELAGIEDDADDTPRQQRTNVPRANVEADLPLSAYPITIGLVVHSLADGLALGMSVLSNNDDSSASYGLSLVVFLALAVHKGELSLTTLFLSVYSLWSSGHHFLRSHSSNRPRLHYFSNVNLPLAGGL